MHRKGLYPIDAFPKALGSEAAGEIVALPTDEKILTDEEYNLRKFAVGGKVAAVRLSTCTLLACCGRTCLLLSCKLAMSAV